MAASLLLPFILAYATYLLSTDQQRTANRQKLVDAYVSFGTTMTEFRRAAATFEVLTNVADPTGLPLAEVKKAVLDFDAAFNAIGAKLGPFEEAARRNDEYRGSDSWKRFLSHPATTIPNAIDELSRTWNSCFVVPYYGTSAVPYQETYWFKINETLKSCTAEKCPQAVSQRISSIIYDIWSGTCVCERPERQRPMSWLYPVMQGLMEGRDVSQVETPPGKTSTAAPNPDLIAPSNAYCISHPPTGGP